MSENDPHIDFTELGPERTMLMQQLQDILFHRLDNAKFQYDPAGKVASFELSGNPEPDTVITLIGRLAARTNDFTSFTIFEQEDPSSEKIEYFTDHATAEQRWDGNCRADLGYDEIERLRLELEDAFGLR